MPKPISPSADLLPVSAPTTSVPALAPGQAVRVWEHPQLSFDARILVVHANGLIDAIIERPGQPITLSGVHPRQGQGSGYEVVA